MTARLLFLHGLEGKPTGRKATALREAGWNVMAPSLPKDDFEKAVQIARRTLEQHRPDLIVGSSRGGAVAMRIGAEGGVPLVLCAPAWRKFGIEPVLTAGTRIIHGIKDSVVPLADSIELESNNGLPPENLIPVNDEHRLSSPLALATLVRVVGEAVQAGAERKGNQIFVIRPYLWNGQWVFDDPSVGLDKEPLIAGMPEMIELACSQASIKNPEKGFVALFSAGEFPTAQVRLDRVRDEAGGNVYRWAEAGIEGWLCPALFRYLNPAPEKLFVEVKPLK
jgi:hypothetical protein